MEGACMIVFCVKPRYENS